MMTFFYLLPRFLPVVCGLPRTLFTVLAFLVLAACAGNGQFPSPGDSAKSAKAEPSSVTIAQPKVIPPAGPAGLASPVVGAVTAKELADAKRAKLDPDVITVGLLLPLSGPDGLARVAKALQNAAFMALFDLADDKLNILPRDTRGTPEGAIAAAESVLDEGAQLIIGPLLSGSVKAISPLAEHADIPIIAFSSDRSAANEGVYLLSFTPYQEIMRIISYARSKGMEKFALLAPNTPYGDAVRDAVKEAMARYGGTIVQEESYGSDGEGMEEAVKRLADYDVRRKALLLRRRALKASGSAASRRELERLKKRDTLGELDLDAVILPEGGDLLIRIATLLAYYDVDLKSTRLLGTGLWNDLAISWEPTTQGAWFAAPKPGSFDRFAIRYEKLHGRKPPRIATLAYDTAALVSLLSQQKGNVFEFETLTLASGFDGKDGLFRFLVDGNAERGLAVLQVGPKRFKVQDPPARAFGEPGV